MSPQDGSKHLVSSGAGWCEQEEQSHGAGAGGGGGGGGGGVKGLLVLNHEAACLHLT